MSVSSTGLTAVREPAVRMVEFFLDEPTPSKNSPILRTSWKTKAERKAAWQERVIAELEKLELPRPIPKRGPLIVYCTLRFKARRDQESPNYYGFASEVILDALIGGHPNYSRGETRTHDGWLYDDTDDQVEFDFDILRDRGLVGTAVRLVWRTP
jgi:hypothetical protein